MMDEKDDRNENVKIKRHVRVKKEERNLKF